MVQQENQPLHKIQKLQIQKSNEQQEMAESKNKELHDQYFECIIINMLNIQQVLIKITTHSYPLLELFAKIEIFSESYRNRFCKN